jgi:hypothetical protein
MLLLQDPNISTIIPLAGNTDTRAGSRARGRGSLIPSTQVKYNSDNTNNNGNGNGNQWQRK